MSGVLVNSTTRRIVDFGRDKGTPDAIEVDVMFFPKGREPSIGMKIDPQLDTAYEIKTSAGGAISRTQSDKYQALFGKSWRKVTSNYRLASGGRLIDNVDSIDRMKVLKSVGLGFTVYQMLSADAHGEEYDRLCMSIEKVQSPYGGAADKFLDRQDLVDSFKSYIDAVSGGYSGDASGLVKYFADQEAIKAFGENR